MKNKNNIFICILSIGAFGILNTELGFVGILPFIAAQFNISVVRAGLLISLFALGVAVAGPTMPLLFSRVNHKTTMLLVLSIFIIGNIISIFTTDFNILLAARIIPAFFQPVYCSMAFSLAAASAAPQDAPKAVSKIMIGVSAGMVIGVPMSNFLAAQFSLQTALSFFAAVNILVFLLTVLFIPSLPVKNCLSYGSQVGVLRNPAVLLAIIVVILLNGSIYGVFNYLADYLQNITKLVPAMTSFALFLYGVMNIAGSILAGELLTRSVLKTVRFFMASLFILYCLLFFSGMVWLPMLILTVLWGVLGGLNANITQYWLSHAAPEAPDFANGLFLTATNLGTMLATSIGGLFIAQWGVANIIFVGLIFILLAAAAAYLQIKYLPIKIS